MASFNIDQLSVTVNTSGIASVSAGGGEIDITATDLVKVLNTTSSTSAGVGSFVCMGATACPVLNTQVARIQGTLELHNAASYTNSSYLSADTTSSLVVSSGIKFPTASATAAPLAYYELLNIPVTVSGPWAATQSMSLTIEQVGARVCIGWPSITATANTATYITSVGGVIPARFRRTREIVLYCYVYNGSATPVAGSFYVRTGGSFRIYLTPNVNFTGSGATGVAAGSVSYIIGPTVN
jgi:hypothetical protein